MSTGPVDTSKKPIRTLAHGTLGRRQTAGWLLVKAPGDQPQREPDHQAIAQLEKSGNFNNLRWQQVRGEGEYRTPMFMDSDVYKWLEAIGYELAANPNPRTGGDGQPTPSICWKQPRPTTAIWTPTGRWSSRTNAGATSSTATNSTAPAISSRRPSPMRAARATAACSTSPVVWPTTSTRSSGRTNAVRHRAIQRSRWG